MVQDGLVSQLNKIKYSGAIKHYTNKRQDFLAQYNNNIKVNNKDLLNSGIIGGIINEINQSVIKEQRADVQKLIIPTIEESARKIVNANNGSICDEIKQLLISVKDKTQEDSDDLKKQADKKLDEYISKILENDALERKIIDSIQFQLVDGSYNVKDIVSRATAMRRTMIYKLITTPEQDRESASVAGIDWFGKNVIAGYYRESMVASAFAKLLGKVAKQTGNTPVTKIIDGKKYNVDSSIDVLISDLENTQKVLQALDGNTAEEINIDTSKSYGIQVKSWLSNRDKYPSDLSIGSRKNLVLQLKNKNSWIQGALFFKHTKNVLEALGENNVAWVTGDRFYFTDDFIKMMRQKDYLINFIYQKDKEKNNYVATNKVRWQIYGTFFNE